MKSTPKPAVVRRGRGRGRGAGAGAVVPYARATPQTNGAGGDFQRPAQKGSHVQAVLHEYPLTPTPLTVRAQRQHRRSEAGFRPRIVELDPDTDRTLQRTPAPSTVGRRSSVQSRLSSVTSFSRGDVITSTRLESPAQAHRRSAAASVASGTPTPFAKPRTPAQRRRSGQRASEAQQQQQPPPPVQETSAAAPQSTAADNWQTPISRRSAADSASRSASTAAASSANSSKASAKQNSTASAKRSPTASAKLQNSSRSGPPSGDSAQRGSGGRGRGRPRKNPSPQSGGSGQLGSAQRGSGGRGRGRPRKQPSPQPSPEPSDHEEMEASEEENVTLDNSDDRTFRPSPGERRRLAAAEAAAARRRAGDRTATGGRGRTGRDTSELGRTASSAAATGRGDQRKSAVGSPRKSAGQSRMSTNMTARSRRSSNHPALAEEPARRSSAASRGGKRSSTAALRCPLTVLVAGRSRVIAANSTEDVLEAVEDLITAAHTRPLQCYPDIGKFQWDLDQCVIDLLALKKAKRQGAVKMLTAVRKVRTAAEDVLQPVKVELVELYNAAFKADKERRRDEEVRAFLFDDDDEAER